MYKYPLGSQVSKITIRVQIHCTWAEDTKSTTWFQELNLSRISRSYQKPDSCVTRIHESLVKGAEKKPTLRSIYLIVLTQLTDNHFSVLIREFWK